MELSVSKAPGKVGVMVVCPGIIFTPLAQNIRAAEHITEQQLTQLRQYYAAHGCKPEVIAQGIVKNLWKDRLIFGLALKH